jgi:hypothetical protein
MAFMLSGVASCAASHPYQLKPNMGTSDRMRWCATCQRMVRLPVVVVQKVGAVESSVLGPS